MTTGNFFMTFWHSGLNYQSHGSDHKQNLSLAEVGCFITAFRAGNVLIMKLKEKKVPNLRGACAAHDTGAGSGINQ